MRHRLLVDSARPAYGRSKKDNLMWGPLGIELVRRGVQKNPKKKKKPECRNKTGSESGQDERFRTSDNSIKDTEEARSLKENGPKSVFGLICKNHEQGRKQNSRCQSAEMN